MGNASASGRSTLSSQYFLYFGIMGVFLPYFNLYCYKLGFTGFQIGIISALRSVVMIISPLLLSVVADRFQARKPIYLSCNFIGAAIWSLYLFTSDFWPMLAVTFCYTIFYSPIISFLEAFTIDILGTMKKSYGSIRVWGTIAFIVTVYLLGRALDNYPIRIILYLILAGSLVQALFAIMIPDIKPVARKPFLNEVQTLIKRKRVIFFLVSAFLKPWSLLRLFLNSSRKFRIRPHIHRNRLGYSFNRRDYSNDKFGPDF
jgi:MFS transporter, PPP family, 3-phenylpropionic acid transporter